MLSDALGAMKHKIMGLFTLNKALLFWGVNVESCAGTTSAAGAGGEGVAVGASTDDSVKGMGSDATDSELDSDS